MISAARNLDGIPGFVVTTLLAVAAGFVLVVGAAGGHAIEAALGLIALLLLAVGWKDERLLLAAFVLSFVTVSHPALRLKLGGLWIPAPAVVAGALCARELAWRAAADRPEWPRWPALPLLFLFTGFVASGSQVVNPPAYLADLVKWSAHVMVFTAMLLVLRRPRWVYALVDGLSIVVGALSAYGLYRVFTGLSYDIDVFEGVASRSAAAFYITAVLPLVYARLADKRGVQRLARSALFAVLLTAQVFTYTRAAWIASACGLLFVAGRRLRAYLWVALAAGVLALAAPPEVQQRFQTIFTTVDYGVDSPLASSTVLRQHLLRTGIEMVRGNWLLGVGLGNYWDNYARYAVPGSPPLANTPHNFWVLLWSEAGLIAVSAFGWFYLASIWTVWKVRQHAGDEARAVLLGFAGCFVALLVESQFSNDLNLLVTWTLLGAGTALARLAGREGR